MADIKVDDSASPSRRGSFDTRSIKSQTSKKKATDEQGVYDGPTLDAGASSSNKSHAAADADEALEYEREELALKTRFGALALLLFLAAGANWGDSALGPLKSTIVKELKIDNTQYGIIASAVQLTNTIIPIFSGLWIDRYGAAHMAVVATLAVFVGSIVTASGAQSDSYATVVAGRVIQGLGYLTADTTTAKLIITWFRGGGWLAFAVSFNFAFERAISVASKASAVPISQSTGDYAWTLWVGSIICGVSFVFSLAYVGYERWAMPAHMRSLQEFKKHQTKDARVQTFDAPYNRRNILKAASTLPAFFVFLTATQFYQPIAVFNNLSADIIRRKGKTVEVSGYLSSVNQIVPIVVTPMLGAFFDRFGHRMEFVPLTAILYMITFALLAYTEANPLIAMIISSFGQAFNTAPYLCSIPLLISDNTTIGFAWGLWKAMAATSQIIMDTSLGKVQDESPNQSYTNVLTILLAVKALEFGFGILYVLFDHRFAAGILSADEKKRRALESEHGGGREALVRSAGKRTSGLKAYRWSNCWGAIQFGSQILIAWTLFFAFLT